MSDKGGLLIGVRGREEEGLHNLLLCVTTEPTPLLLLTHTLIPYSFISSESDRHTVNVNTSAPSSLNVVENKLLR